MFIVRKKRATYTKDDFSYTTTTFSSVDLLKSKKYRKYIETKINRELINKINKIYKEGDDGSYRAVVVRCFRLYFSYVVLKCIQGYLVPLLNDSTYFFKVYGYYEDENEKAHKSKVNELITNRYGKDTSIDTTDFWNKKYRIGLFKLDKETNLYNYTGYFLRLNKKYKKALEKAIKEDNINYDNIQFRI